MSSASSETTVQHPDNLLNTGCLPAQLEAELRTDGIRFATELQTASGHSFLLCGHRCPTEAGVDMMRNAMRARRDNQQGLNSSDALCTQHFDRREADHLFDAGTRSAEQV